MKKEDQLLDNLLREYHEAGDGDDQKFMDSVLNEVKEKKQISDSSPTQTNRSWSRFIAPSIAAAAVVSASWYVYQKINNEGDTVALHKSATQVKAANELVEEDSFSSEIDSTRGDKVTPSKKKQPSAPSSSDVKEIRGSILSENKKGSTAAHREIAFGASSEVEELIFDDASNEVFGTGFGDAFGAEPAENSFAQSRSQPARVSEPGLRRIVSPKPVPPTAMKVKSKKMEGRSVFGKVPIDTTHHGDQHGNLEDSAPCLTANKDTSTFSVDVDTASYSQLRRSLRSNTIPHPDSVRIEEMVNYFKYDYPQPNDGHPFSINVEATICPWNEEHRLVKIGLQGKVIENDERKPANLVFLIDSSGSMSAPDKLPLLQASLAKLVKTMNEKDTISIVTYAGKSGIALAPTKVTEDNKDRIEAVLQDLRPSGSTNGESGIKLAYKLATENQPEDGVSRVILATDGDFNVGISDSSQLTNLVKEKAKSGVEVSVLGFGRGNLNDRMLESITNNGNGNYSYIDTDREAYRVLVENIGGTLQTIAKDVKIQAVFDKDTVRSYRLIGYANRKLKKEDFDNDKVDAGEIGAGHSVTAIYQIEPVNKSSDANQDADIVKVKLRYKQPKGTESTLLEQSVPQQYTPINEASQDMKFTSGVALYGMILRDSKYKGTGNKLMVANLAKQGVTDTDTEAKQEFLSLIGHKPAENEGLEGWER